MTLKLMVIFALMAITYGQTIDTNFCNPQTIPTVSPQLPFPLAMDPTIQFEMNMEVNTGLTRYTYELDQYYDGLLNQAVDIITQKGVEFKIYTYDKTEEVIIVSGDRCFVQPLNTSTLSPIPSMAFNGTQHILAPFQLWQLNNPDFRLGYIGKSTVRGIPVNQWQVCSFTPSQQITQRITYSFSDPSQWSIAVPSPNMTTTPVETRIDNKLANGTTWIDIYTITKFRPQITTKDEFWLTPSGVICPGRKSTKNTPKVPKAFKFRAQVVQPIPGFDDLIGTILNIREVYDYPNKIFRMDYSYKASPISEIHDYKTGLRYTLDRFGGSCNITKLDPNSPEAQQSGSFITMKNATSFFDFDSTEYQYTGQRHVNHINTDVWIGTKTIFNITSTWEWYFMADGYIDEVGVVSEISEPVLLIMTLYQTFFNNKTNAMDYVKQPVYYYFYDFDESGLDYADFDISACMDNYPKKHFLFRLDDQHRDLMQKYQTNLKLGVLIGITSNIAVYPTRVSNLQVDFNKDNIVAIFTLLDKSPFYGDVEITTPETSLNDASALLNVTIAAGKFNVPFIVDNTTYFEVPVPKDSLRELDSREPGVVYINNTIVINNCNGTEIPDDLQPFCDPSNIATVEPQIPFQISMDRTIQYQMSIEVNSGLTKSTYEIDQYYDGLLNQAVDIITQKGIEFRVYTYDKTNEVITVSGELCVVEKATQSQISPITSIMLNSTIEHIISPLQVFLLQDPNLKLLYIGKSTIKGIPVNQWQFCNTNSSNNLNRRITLSISDPDAWSVAVTTSTANRAPVQIKILNKFPNGTQWTDTYSISKFRPFISTRYDFWQTPSGVFCKGRNSTKTPPKLPKQFQFRAQVVSPVPGFDEVLGEVSNIREIYDYRYELYRIDYSNKASPMTEIHDYKTGLRYIIDRFEGNCTIDVVNTDLFDAQQVGGFITMKNSSSFFDFDSTEYQYTGQRHVGHMNTDVWIGQRTILNLSSTWEWYFMADGFLQQFSLAIEVNEPVLLIITFSKLVFNNATNQLELAKFPVYYYFYDFDELGFDIFSFDISTCMDTFPKRHFLFEISDSHRELMEKYKTNLKLGVLIGITTSIAVDPIRISNLQIDFNKDSVNVVFTLLDKSPFYGNVNRTFNETSLNDASVLLNATIAAGKFYIPLIIDNTTFYELVARPTSLQEIETRNGNYIYIKGKDGYTKGNVTGIAIGVLMGGMIFGILIAVIFTVFKPQNKCRRNEDFGFENPTFRKTAASSDD